jgi:hemolysin activation/secretion protein
MQVEDTDGRFINNPGIINPEVFENQYYGGATIKYSFKNTDFASKPSLGMGFMISGSWSTNLDNTKQNFPSIESNLSFVHKIDSQGTLVFATLFKTKAILNNNYEFYQGVTLGGDNDLRGYRTERFLGNTSYSQSSDLRYTIGKIRKSIIPLTYGILAGFDYGRIWLDGENSKKWHNDFGGGIWLNGINLITARVSYFQSPDERGRVVLGAAYSF